MGGEGVRGVRRVRGGGGLEGSEGYGEVVGGRLSAVPSTGRAHPSRGRAGRE